MLGLEYCMYEDRHMSVIVTSYLPTAMLPFPFTGNDHKLLACISCTRS